MEGFINSVESQMRQSQEKQKLATISARIDSYEAVEGSSEEVEKVRNSSRGLRAKHSKKSSGGYKTFCLCPVRSSRSTTASTSWLP